jgi:hypothetical protein
MKYKTDKTSIHLEDQDFFSKDGIIEGSFTQSIIDIFNLIVVEDCFEDKTETFIVNDDDKPNDINDETYVNDDDKPNDINDETYVNEDNKQTKKNKKTKK